ncbi:DNA oxidative demethylase AlkB [Bordetella sp. 02P26C-1]|uniref:DNA oxidative demethylase AlkB n=1 Tax=Bordetella sp. 02P26C-1 TaxID=2683195 RepID=UPI0013542B46|nr:DNA oxidative demethylase AlkB [Bordetella sp. 02P26C-1]MVW78771.1 DNA oxidative demethylase AlkB [Bordetella sp. 02P26C-1]
MNLDLFTPDDLTPANVRLAPQAVVLRGFALPDEGRLLRELAQVWEQAPPRHMVTPGGYRMSAALTNCGTLGWTTDERGYRYTRHDPLTGQPWPALPASFMALAQRAAQAAGFPDFQPDACLINRYLPGARMSLHQDKNERDFRFPIASVSLGIPAIFLFGGMKRSDAVQRVALQHGDVAVWGGADRLRYHGVAPLKDATHPSLGAVRVNLTFRRAG